MVNKELINWIKSEEAKGQSEIALTNILIKQGYPKKDIAEAFSSLKKEKKKTYFSISFVLLFGFGFVTSILIGFLLTITSFFDQPIIGYFLLILIGVGMGYLLYYIKNKLKATERWGAIMGIFSPTLPLIIIIYTLKTLQLLSDQLTAFSTSGQTEGFSDMLNIFSLNMDPIISGILFYLFYNMFTIISIIKNKEYQTFLWYLFAPALFLVLWLIINLIASPIMTSPIL